MAGRTERGGGDRRDGMRSRRSGTGDGVEWRRVVRSVQVGGVELLVVTGASGDGADVIEAVELSVGQNGAG